MEKNTMATDEDERINDLLTSKIDEITGGEMKKVGVQKMENELTIKKLDREYMEIKRNMVLSKKMLDEARKNGTTQTETKNQLLHANKAITEKFNELKKYQNEITLINISKGEKSIQDCNDRNDECARILHIILDKENYFDFLNKNLVDKESQLNEDIQRQIEQKKESVTSREGTLFLLTKKIESQKVQIDEEKIDNRIKQAVEERNKRIIQLQADVEAMNKQFRQEIDDLQQKKLDKIQKLENNKNELKTSENRLHELQSQVLESEKSLMDQNENLEHIKKKSQEISCEIQEKRQATSQSSGTFENNIKNLLSESASVNCDLQKEQLEFTEIENKMQNEMEKLFTELEQKKKLQTELENRQRDLSVAKEKRIEQQKLLSQNSELNNKLNSLNEEFKKQVSIGSTNTNTQIELNNKIKELREKRDNSRKQLESLSKIQSQANKVTNYTSESAAKSSTDTVKSSQQINNQKKSYDLYRKDSDLDKNVSSSQTPKKTPQNPPIYDRSSTMFNLDSSDDSEDEFKIIDKTPRKNPQSTVTPIYKNQDYTSGFDDKHDEEPTNERLSQSERLFDELMSQNPTESTLKKKDEDIFKIPATYTPIKKRSASSKKY